jgi:hypothetical protein
VTEAGQLDARPALERAAAGERGADLLAPQIRVAVPGEGGEPFEGARLEGRGEVLRALVLVELDARVDLDVRVVGDAGEVGLERVHGRGK